METEVADGNKPSDRKVLYMNINKYDIRFTCDRIGRLIKEKSYDYDSEKALINSPEKAADLLFYAFDAANLAQEYFWLISLNAQLRVIGIFTVSIGTLVTSLAHPREIFQRAILSGAASIIVAHNHPSGVLKISDSDLEVTTRLEQAGELLGIKLEDALILGNGDYVSIRQSGAMRLSLRL